MQIISRRLGDMYPRIYKTGNEIIIDSKVYDELTKFHNKHKELSWHTVVGAAYMLLVTLYEKNKPNIYYCEDLFIEDLKGLSNLL